ncbi:MAG: 60S ribosomal protein L31 [Candidatus Bathyarchaeota archaeon]|nr:MAG: 60S ribosomal protein L31 [Candidatus Bathyarchaeota archaeon]
MSDEEEVIEDRLYTIPLRRAWIGSIRKRTPRALRILREFIKKHMKTENVLIESSVNQKLWSRGIEKPPRKIRVRALKYRDDVVRVQLVDGE